MYANLINSQIVLAANLKIKTVKKTVISKVAKFPRLDAATEIHRDAPAPCTIYQLLGFISFGELTT